MDRFFAFCFAKTLNQYIGQAGETKENIRGELNQIHCYSSSHNHWSTLPPHWYTHFGLGKIDGKLATVGGWNEPEKKVCRKLYIYTNDEKWEKSLSPMPTRRRYPTIVSQPAHLMAAGGVTINDGEYTNIVKIYNSNMKQWNTAASLPVAAGFQFVGVCNETLYLTTTRTQDRRENGLFTVLLAKLLLSASNAVPIDVTGDEHATWNRLAFIPAYWLSALVVSDVILAMGGFKNDDLALLAEKESKVYAYSALLDNWFHIGNLPNSMAYLTVAPLTAKEFIVIGRHTKDVYKGTFEVSLKY